VHYSKRVDGMSSQPNVQRALDAMARIEKAKTEKADAEAERDDAIYALFKAGMREPEISRTLGGGPGVSLSNVRLVVKIRKASDPD